MTGHLEQTPHPATAASQIPSGAQRIEARPEAHLNPRYGERELLINSPAEGSILPACRNFAVGRQRAQLFGPGRGRASPAARGAAQRRGRLTAGLDYTAIGTECGLFSWRCGIFPMLCRSISGTAVAAAISADRPISSGWGRHRGADLT